MRWRLFLGLLASLCSTAAVGFAEQPLHHRIDKLIDAKLAPGESSPLSDDAEFLRRVTLDLSGAIPTADEVRTFLDDKSPTKRAKKIDELLASPAYPVRMQQLFHVMLMERLGKNPAWEKWLRTSFEKNKPWNQMAREILRADPNDEANRGAAFFLTKRLEKYGQNPTDYPGLVRDVGRFFLGKNLQCAECHDHLFVLDYGQQDFQGLFAFFENTYLADANKPILGERPTTKKRDFMSVFKKIPRKTAPRLPGGAEVVLPTYKKGDEYEVKPDRKKKTLGVLKFSTLEVLSKQLPTADNPDFGRASVNRLWFVMMGRGLVHPLDMRHGDNPASHPELLALLAKEFANHDFDIRWLLRELALTRTYQRSSRLPDGKAKADPTKFATALERRLSAEQLLASILRATRMEAILDDKQREAALTKFEAAFANPPREPEESVNPTLKAALYLLNGPTVLGWLERRKGNLVDQLATARDGEVADRVYLAVLSRRPTPDERDTVSAHLSKHPKDKAKAVGQLVWALLASTEFGVNH